MEYDPYVLADVLISMSQDLAANTSSLTSHEISQAVHNAGRVIEDLADKANHYRMRNRIVIVSNGEEIELEEALADDLISEAVKTIITDAIGMYLTASKVVPGLGGN